MTVCKSKLREVWKCRQKDRPMGGMGCKPGDDGKSEPAGTIREALQKKKNGKMWGIFLICWTLPQFGILLFVKKKNYDLFFILEPQEHFWTSQFFENFVGGIMTPPLFSVLSTQRSKTKFTDFREGWQGLEVLNGG